MEVDLDETWWKSFPGGFRSCFWGVRRWNRPRNQRKHLETLPSYRVWGGDLFVRQRYLSDFLLGGFRECFLKSFGMLFEHFSITCHGWQVMRAKFLGIFLGRRVGQPCDHFFINRFFIRQNNFEINLLNKQNRPQIRQQHHQSSKASFSQFLRWKLPKVVFLFFLAGLWYANFTYIYVHLLNI